MSRKLMISPLFKFPIPWMEQFYANWHALGDDWQHYIFTDEPLVSSKNIKVFRMNAEQFTDLVEETTGCRPYMKAPSPKFGDMRPAFGLIFQKWVKDFEWWGHMDFDVVCGDLDKWVTDDRLSECDIFSTEPVIVNGIFSLYRNNEYVNNYFKQWYRWQELFKEERYCAFDEIEFSELVARGREAKTIRFHGGYYQEHDNQPAHGRPRLMQDGKKLFNADTNREMMLFHFRRTKRWPL